MALPGNITTVTVTGSFTDPAGTALRGCVYFTPSTTLTDPADSTVIAPVARRYDLAGGTFTTGPLAATDNPDTLGPGGWFYLVTVSLQNAQPYTFAYFIAHATGSVQDISTLIPLEPVPAMAGFVPFSGGQLTGPLYASESPVSETEVATKGYVDASTAGLQSKAPVQEATTAALIYGPATYSAGVLSPLTVGALVVDGVSVNVSDRVLVKNESAPANNGIYVATSVGSVSEPWSLTRSPDMDTAAQVPGAYCQVEQGTANSETGWIVASEGPFTLGTTAITWTQLTAPASALAAETSRAEAAEASISSLREFPVALYSGADPTGASDSTSAVTAAQAAAVAAGGGIVSFGTGTWKFQTITVAGVSTPAAYIQPPLVHFRFAGAGATILTPLNANSPLFQVQSGKYAAGVRMLGGFTVKAHASGSAGPAINLTNARQWVIESPSYLDSLEGGSGTPGTYAQVIGFGVNTYGCRITDPVCEAQRLGACFIGSISSTLVIANQNVIENALFEDNTATYMIDAAGTWALSITDCLIEGNTLTGGASIRLGKQTKVSHCYFESNTTGEAWNTFYMDAAGTDGYYPPGDPGADIPYDPGGCLLELNQYYSAPDTLTIPSGVTPGTMVVGPLNVLSITDDTESLLLNFQPAAGSTTYLNNAAGGTNSTTVTTGNSGSTSGQAFSAVAGSPAFSNAETYSPSALSYKLATSASNEGFSWTLPSSILAGQTIYLRTYAYFSGSVFSTNLLATEGLWYEAGSNGTDFYVRAVPGATETTVAVSANTWYRVEMEVGFSGGTAVLNVYDALGNLLGSATGTGGTEISANGSVQFGQYSGGGTTGTVYLANLGLTNGTWLGPAIPGVESVTAGDASIVIGGTQETPTIGTGTLDVIAAQHPPAATWSNNGKKITSLANGSASTDAAAFGQLPSSSSPLAIGSGGTGANSAPASTAYAAKASAADITYYVSTDAAASDSNDGLSPGSAKATIAGALTALGSSAGLIQLGAGTFTIAAADGSGNGATLTYAGTCVRGLGMNRTSIVLGANVTYGLVAEAAECEFSGFTLSAATSVTVTYGVGVTTTTSAESCRYSNIIVASGAGTVTNAFAVSPDHHADVAYTTFFGCIGTEVTNAGWILGDGTQANVLDTRMFGCVSQGNAYGVYSNATGFQWLGGDMGENTTADVFLASPTGSPVTVQGMRSENSAALFTSSGANTLSTAVSLRDIAWQSGSPVSTGIFISYAFSGTLNLDNVQIVSLTSVVPCLLLSGTTPCVTASGLSTTALLGELFSATPTQNASVVVTNYQQVTTSFTVTGTNVTGPVSLTSSGGFTFNGSARDVMIPGPLALPGSPPIKLPSGTSGDVLTSDGSGNLTLQSVPAVITAAQAAGYVGWVGDLLQFPPLTAPASATWTAGVEYLRQISVAPSVTVNGYISFFWDPHSGMANSYFSVYTVSAGVLTLVGSTADQSSNASYYYRVAVSGFTSTPASGVLYVGYMNGTSGVAGGPYYLGSAWAQNTPASSQVPSAAQYRYIYNGGSYSSPPSSITMSASNVAAAPYWCALD